MNRRGCWDSTIDAIRRGTIELSGASPGYLVYPTEQVEWAVGSVDFGFILQNIELCYFKRVVPKDVLQAFEWHPCQVQMCCCCSPNVVRSDSTSDARSLDSVSKYPAHVVVVAVVAFE